MLRSDYQVTVPVAALRCESERVDVKARQMRVAIMEKIRRC
jgi:hypothetical protein